MRWLLSRNANLWLPRATPDRDGFRPGPLRHRHPHRLSRLVATEPSPSKANRIESGARRQQRPRASSCSGPTPSAGIAAARKPMESWRLRKKLAGAWRWAQGEWVFGVANGRGRSAIRDGKEEAAIRSGLSIVIGTGNGILLGRGEVKR
ncbi:hypothetical protein ABZP36_026728 [Zizania latifolia]